MKPGARQAKVGPWAADCLHLAVTARAHRGQANQAATDLLAKALHVPKTGVRVVAGLRSRKKRIEVLGLTAEELAQRLAALS